MSTRTGTAFRRRTFLTASLAAAAAASGACGFAGSDDDAGAEPAGENSDAPQRGGTLKQSMVPVTHLDPAIQGNQAHGQVIIGATMEGLLVLNEDGTDVLAGVAEDWNISEDQLTYTFTIRSDAKWSNGDPVTAEDFEWNWSRILTPGIAGEGVPSYNPAPGVVNGRAHLDGAVENFDEVGVKALDESTLEITLEGPNPDFLLLLAGQVWGYPLHPATVEEHGEGWFDPANWVSNGPFVLDSFRVNDMAVLVPNNEYWDNDSYLIDRWEIQFNDGGLTADILSYTNEEIDVSGDISGDLAAVINDPGLEAELVTSPRNRVRQLVVLNSHNPALHDARVRKALSLAIDREELAQVAAPEVAGPSIVPDGVPGSELIPAIPFDLDLARTLLADAGYPDAQGMPTVTFLLDQATPWVEALGEMWRTNLGINTTLDVVEAGVLAEKQREVHPEDYTGFMANSVGVDPATLFNTVRGRVPLQAGSTTGTNLIPADLAEEFWDMVDGGAPGAELQAFLNENRYPEVQEFLALAADARAEPVPETQQDLLVRALVAFQEASTAIPVLWGGRNLLIKSGVQNLHLRSDGALFSARDVSVQV